jgi:hypothetical protein
MEVDRGANVGGDHLEEVADLVPFGEIGQEDSMLFGEPVEEKIRTANYHAVTFFRMPIHRERFGAAVDDDPAILFRGYDSNEDCEGALVVIVDSAFGAVGIGEDVGSRADFGELVFLGKNSRG